MQLWVIRNHQQVSNSIRFQEMCHILSVISSVWKYVASFVFIFSQLIIWDNMSGSVHPTTSKRVTHSYKYFPISWPSQSKSSSYLCEQEWCMYDQQRIIQQSHMRLTLGPFRSICVQMFGDWVGLRRKRKRKDLSCLWPPSLRVYPHPCFDVSTSSWS